MVDPRGPGPAMRGDDFSDPLSSAIQAWINAFAKAAKGMRVYAENNEMLHKYLDAAHVGLERLLEKIPELHLSIREDRIIHGKDTVHINADREEGIPFIFYRNAFRRVTLVRGMSRDELKRLLRALVTDYQGYNSMGEDLVTTLWRESLPHLRYLTIDAISSGKKGVSTDLDQDELERIQGNIEDIVAAIYQTNATDDDIVAGVSITKEDLEALKDIRAESEEDLDMLDQATSRAIAKISKPELDAVHDLIDSDTRDRLTSEMLEILVRMLFKETSSKESASTIDLLQRLFDSLVLAQDYPHAIDLIERLREVADDSQNMQEMHIARHLLRLFAAESRVLPVLNALNDGYTTASVGDMFTFLRALGSPIRNVLLGALEIVTSPAHRRLLCDLIVEFGVPDVARLMKVSESAKWFVVRDVLSVAQHHPPEKISILIKQALAHDHPKVRAYAVGMLRGYARGLADTILVERIHDEDLDVRLSAIRVAAARRSVPARDALHAMLTAEDLGERDSRELRLAMAAYATIGRAEAVPLLDEILNPGFLKTLKNTEPQVAAAFALASCGPAGTDALTKGARSLNSKVRDACKRALSRKSEKTDGDETRTSDVPAKTKTERASIAGIPAEKTDPKHAKDDSGRTPLAGIPAYKTDPKNAADDGVDDITPPEVATIDIDEAPPFYLYDPSIDGDDRPTPLPHEPHFKPRPSMSSVMTPYPTPDLIPENLPPAPRDRVQIGSREHREAPPPDTWAPPSAAGSRDVLPDSGEWAPPSAAGSRDVLPDSGEWAPPSAAGSRDVLPDSGEWSPPSAAGSRDVLPEPRETPPMAAGSRDVSADSNTWAPPSAAGSRDVFPGPSETWAPPSAAGSRDVFPDSGEWAPPAMAHEVPDISSAQDSLPEYEPPRVPPPRRPPPRAKEADDVPSWVKEAMASAESEDGMSSGSDDIPSADDVVASLFGDVDSTADGDRPLDADHTTGDISTSPEPTDAPYIPTVDSDPYATTDGALPPPRPDTWAGRSEDPEPPPPVLPWVDDLVLDDPPPPKRSKGTEDD